MKYLREFELFEKEQRLDQSMIWSVKWWSLCRYSASQFINDGLNPAQPPQSAQRPKKRDLIHRCFLFITRLMMRSSTQKTIIFLAHPRLKNDGDLTDIYTDSVLSELPESDDLLQLEPVRHSNESKRLSEPFRIPLDLIYILSTIIYIVVDNFLMMIGEKRRVIDKLSDDLSNDQFMDLNGTGFASFAYSRLLKFKIHRWFYTILFRYTKASALILSVSSGNEAIISGASLCGLKVIELQHGTPVRGKLNYDYSSGINKEYAVDYFFGYGGFFSHDLDILPRKIQRVTLGNPYLQKKIEIASTRKDKAELSNILFISQYPIDKSMASWIKSNSRILQRFNCHIALHPSYINQRVNPYKDIDFLTLLPEKPNALFDELARSDIVIGGFSTALYEAYAFGNSVIVLKELSRGMVSRAVDEKYFYEVSTLASSKELEKLIGKLESECSRGKKKQLFDIYETGQFAKLLGAILNE
ncbi:hypothetical protein OAS81_04500 [Gammaproteobacteria bacterium]|nr:hypothetical protein [Gammaproteobacteria bacterium]